MADIEKKSTGFNNPFTALRHRNFRLYWSGMCVSLIGTWMQNTAQPWLAYTLTGSPFLLSLVGILQFTPVLFFSLFAGVIIDRFPKKKILLVTQSSALLTSLALALLVQTGHIRYWHILLMAAVMGFVNTFDMPARQSFVIELTGREDLMNAIALNSSVFNIARIVGPALAGLVMGYLGIEFCFYANSASFAAVITGLLFIKPAVRSGIVKRGMGMLRETKKGMQYILHNRILMEMLIIMAIVGTFAMNFNVLVPVFAKTVLKQQETGFGFLMSFMGVGSFLGAMLVATVSKGGPRSFVLKYLPVSAAVFLILTAFTGAYLLTGLCLALTGFSFVTFSSTANSTMQLNTDDEYRGRVMGAYSLVFAGSTPLGNLYAGVISDSFGPGWGFAACGLAILILMALTLFIRSRAPRVKSSTDM